MKLRQKRYISNPAEANTAVSWPLGECGAGRAANLMQADEGHSPNG